MNHILVAFAGKKTRQRMTEIFDTTGIRVSAACASGAEVLRWCGRMNKGVILCGYKLADMTAETLFQSLPKNFSLVVLATEAQLEYCRQEEIMKILAPVQRSELIDTIRMLLEMGGESDAPVPSRREEDKALIEQAKALLMTRNHMTEEEAHRFLQKYSMNTGTKMVQTALKVLDGQIVI